MVSAVQRRLLSIQMGMGNEILLAPSLATGVELRLATAFEFEWINHSQPTADTIGGFMTNDQ
jgi:hypothetical protein